MKLGSSTEYQKVVKKRHVNSMLAGNWFHATAKGFLLVHIICVNAFIFLQ
jgi:hypothetical protein